MVHGFGQSSKDCSAPPHNWRGHLSSPSGWVSHGKCTNICNAHWTRPTMNHDTRLSIVMIHQATILHGLSTLREYWAYAKINRRLWPMGETLKWSYILMYWFTIDGDPWQQVFSVEAPWYFIGLRQCIGWLKGHVIMKSMAIIIPLMEFDICSLELEYVNWSHNKWDL